jgi:hypothetical protein
MHYITIISLKFEILKAFFPNKEFTEMELKYPKEDLIYSLMEWGKFKKAYEIYAKCKDQSMRIFTITGTKTFSTINGYLIFI